MKILILLLFAFWGQSNLNAQSGVNAQNPVYLKAPAQHNWQVSQAINLAGKILLVGQSKAQSSTNKMLLILSNLQGKTQWVKEYPYTPVQAVAAFNNNSIAVLNASRAEMLLTRLSLTQGEVVWQTSLKKMLGGSLATQPNGRLAVATENETFIVVSLFSETGKKSKEVKLSKLYKTSNTCKITSLSDGTYAIAGGGKVWGLSESGEILWQFSSKAEPINWQIVKQTQNGEIVLAGTNQSLNGTVTQTDIHVWGIAKDGNKISWVRLLGEDTTQDEVSDFIELSNGELLLLCSENKQNQLIKLDTEHQASLVYTASSYANHQFKYLIANANHSFTLIGNIIEENNKQIFIQNFESIPPVIQRNKPSLFLLSIGAGKGLVYVKNNAKSLSSLFEKQAGRAFQKIYTKTITDDNATKAGELAKVFEALSTQAIKNEDLTIVYFSGNGQALPDDYLLHASDFDAALLRSTTIRLSQLVHDLDNLPGKKLIILDASQSGAAKHLLLPKNISILTASTAVQGTYEDARWQHSAFSKILIDAFTYKKADINTDGYISLVELYEYAAMALPALIQKDKDQLQNPILLHKGDDLLIFE